MKYDARTCHFNMDTGCVELLLRDGRKISIDCTGVEGAMDATMAQRAELDYLIRFGHCTSCLFDNSSVKLCKARHAVAVRTVRCEP